MSGNSQDRRRFRRAIVNVLGLVVSTPEPEPTLFENLVSWPVVAAAAPILVGIGVGQMLAPIYVPDICFVVALLLVLVRFFTWPVFLRSPKGKARAASIVLATTLIPVGLLIYWNHKDAPFSFPWLATQDSPDKESLLLLIRDYPTEEPDRVVYASMQPLYTLRLSVMQFDPRTGYEIEIRKIKDDWSSADAHIPICDVEAKVGTTTIIEFQGMSKDAQWIGFLLLRRNGDHVERRAGLLGQVSLPRKKEKIEMTEELVYDPQKRLSKIRYHRYRMTREEAKRWGIPDNAKLLFLTD
jgi:hypothetical protein